MTNTDIVHLREALSTVQHAFIQALEQLDAERRDVVGVCGNWSAKDVIAHLIGWDAALLSYLDDPLNFNPEPLYACDTFNAQSVSDRQAHTWQQCIDELRSHSIKLEDALSSLIAEAPHYKRVCEWLQGRIEDYEHHCKQVTAWNESTN